MKTCYDYLLIIINSYLNYLSQLNSLIQYKEVLGIQESIKNTRNKLYKLRI